MQERAETEREQGEILTREEFDAALSDVGMHLSGRYERMLSAHDLALRCQRDRLVRALLDHACDCGPMDPDLAEHRETCPFREAVEAVEGDEDDDLPPPWGEGVEPDEADRRAFGRLLEENTNLAQEVRKVYDDALSEERPGGSGERGEQYEGQGFTAGECIADALGEIHRWRRGAAGSTYDPLDHIEGRLRQALDRLRRSTPDAGEVRCRKCGSTDVATAWKPEVESTIDRGYKGCRNKDEHLHRTCRECRYTWDDPPADHPTPDEEADSE